MIENKKSRCSSYGVLQDIKKHYKSEPTVEDVLYYLMGDVEDRQPSDFVVYKYRYNKKRSVIKRVNTLWVYPLFILSIPLQWLFTGDIGVNRNSKIGKVVDYLVELD